MQACQRIASIDPQLLPLLGGSNATQVVYMQGLWVHNESK